MKTYKRANSLKLLLSANVKTCSRSQMAVYQRKHHGKKLSKKMNANLTCSRVEGIKSSNLHVTPCLKSIITTHRQKNFTRKQSEVLTQSQQNPQLQMRQQKTVKIRHSSTTARWFTWIHLKCMRHLCIKKRKSNRTMTGWRDLCEKGESLLI